MDYKKLCIILAPFKTSISNKITSKIPTQLFISWIFVTKLFPESKNAWWRCKLVVRKSDLLSKQICSGYTYSTF